MDDENHLTQKLKAQGFSGYEADMPHIRSILSTIKETETDLEARDLIEKKPVMVLDKELMS